MLDGVASLERNPSVAASNTGELPLNSITEEKALDNVKDLDTKEVLNMHILFL